MIPKTIHYCWFGRGPMPELALKCIESWRKHMPDWEYKLWNEDNFDVNSMPYTKEAYESKKFAFVSDVVRLFALKEYGGVYLDTDVEVFKAFDDLLDNHAFAGIEGSKYKPIGTCVLGSEAQGQWVNEQLSYYSNRHFLSDNGVMDMTTNVTFITKKMVEKGYRQMTVEHSYHDLHIYPVEYFCPMQTTGEYFFTENTYCDHKGIGSWTNHQDGIKSYFLSLFGPKIRVTIIKLKRKLLG